MRSAALIYNPVAGMRKRRRVLSDLQVILETGGVEVRLSPTEGPGHASVLAADAAATGGVDTVLVYGGDGTLREAARGLIGSGIALAPLSAGTTNVVTRALRLPVEPRRAAKALLRARPQACRVGMCNEEPFLILVSFGIDAAIMRTISSRAKNLGGRAAVVLQGLRELSTYPFPETTWEADGASGSAAFLAAANIAEYGGDFRLAPDAGFLEPRLRLVAFTGKTRRATLRFGLALLLGRHLRLASVEARTIDELRVPGPSTAPLQLDGDFLDLAPPFRIRKSSRRVHLLMPPEARP